MRIFNGESEIRIKGTEVSSYFEIVHRDNARRRCRCLFWLWFMDFLFDPFDHYEKHENVFGEYAID